jgi:hypothetical protein
MLCDDADVSQMGDVMKHLAKLLLPAESSFFWEYLSLRGGDRDV